MLDKAARLASVVVAATAVKVRARVHARRDRCRRRTLTVPTRRHWCVRRPVWTHRSSSRRPLQPRRQANTTGRWTPRPRRRRREGRTRWATAMRWRKCRPYMTSTNRCRRAPMTCRHSSSSRRTTAGKRASFLTGELADVIKPPAQRSRPRPYNVLEVLFTGLQQSLPPLLKVSQRVGSYRLNLKYCLNHIAHAA